MLKRIKRHKIRFNLLILSSLMALTVLDILPLVLMHKVPQGADMQFHWQEMLELIKSHQLFPRYALNSFLNSGSASLTMYPYSLLYPFALIFKITHSAVITDYLLLLTNIFIAFVISYYSSLLLDKNKLISYVFSIIYTISFPIILNSFGTYDISMNYAFAIMPLILFGYLKLLRDCHWIMLSVGMVLLVYISSIMTACTVILLAIFTGYNYRFLNKEKLIQIVKASTLTLVNSALYWLPALKLMLFNRLKSMATSNIYGVNPIKAVKTSLKTYDALGPVGWQYTLTIYSLIGTIVGLCTFKHLSKIWKHCYIFSIFVLFLTSDVFPWRFIHHSFLNNIQTPWRMFLIPQVFITYILAVYLTKLLIKLAKFIKVHKGYLLLVLVFIVLGVQYYNQRPIIKTTVSGRTNVAALTNISRHKNINGQLTDYYPKQSLPVYHNFLNNEAVYHGKRIKVRNLGNGNFGLVNKRTMKNISLPFLDYCGTNYKCDVNGKKVKSYPNKNQLLTLPRIGKGSQWMHIRVPLTKTDIVARVMTVIGMLMWIIIGVKYLKKRNHVVD